MALHAHLPRGRGFPRLPRQENRRGAASSISVAIRSGTASGRVATRRAASSICVASAHVANPRTTSNQTVSCRAAVDQGFPPDRHASLGRRVARFGSFRKLWLQRRLY